MFTELKFLSPPSNALLESVVFFVFLTGRIAGGIISNLD